MKIHLLNHSSVVIESKDVKLLCDPWLFGTCFEGGWGLKYENPEGLEISKDCTHLWISHFHQDHFHLSTLLEIAKLNPDIIVLANNSYNFQMDSAIQRAGFKNIIRLYERQYLKITDNFKIKRFPTTGIDNMLLINTDECSILNYNDCNIPRKARERLAKKIGKVDFILNNFNHAGKLLEYCPTDHEVMEKSKERFVDHFSTFNPKWVIPFASYHYYRAQESYHQNSSLMGIEDLLELDSRIVSLHVGDYVEFDTYLNPNVVKGCSDVKRSQYTIEKRNNSYSLNELKSACEQYRERIRKGFFNFNFFVPPLNIRIEDLNICVQLSMKKGLVAIKNLNDVIHIAAHSESIYKWFSKPYGTDSFWIGAHFSICDKNTYPLKIQLLIGLLLENRLDIKSLLKILLTFKGIKFLLNRREEILHLLTSFNFHISDRE